MAQRYGGYVGSPPKSHSRGGGGGGGVNMTWLLQAQELPHKSWCALGTWLLPFTVKPPTLSLNHAQSQAASCKG